jgi:hypothetical protein
MTVRKTTIFEKLQEKRLPIYDNYGNFQGFAFITPRHCKCGVSRLQYRPNKLYSSALTPDVEGKWVFIQDSFPYTSKSGLTTRHNIGGFYLNPRWTNYPKHSEYKPNVAWDQNLIFVGNESQCDTYLQYDKRITTEVFLREDRENEIFSTCLSCEIKKLVTQEKVDLNKEPVPVTFKGEELTGWKVDSEETRQRRNFSFFCVESTYSTRFVEGEWWVINEPHGAHPSQNSYSPYREDEDEEFELFDSEEESVLQKEEDLDKLVDEKPKK